MKVFGIFSKSMQNIWFVLLKTEDIIVVHMRTKFQVHTNFCSRDMVQKVVKILGFRELLEKYRYDLVHSLRERRYYRSTFACEVSSPFQLLFSRYGAKREQK